MAVDLGEHLGQEVVLAHGVQQPHGGKPEAQQAGADGAQDGSNAEHHSKDAPAAAQLLHHGDSQEAAHRGAAFLHQGLHRHAAQAEEEQRVDDAAGNDGTQNGLVGVLDGEVAFLHHLGHRFKPEEGGDQQGHTDDPAGDAEVAFHLSVEEVLEVIPAPHAGEQEGDGGDQAAADGEHQHVQLDLAGDLHILQAQDAVAHQAHQGHHLDQQKAGGDVQHMEQPLHDGHDRRRRHRDPGGHDQPRGEEAHMLVDTHGVVDELAARLGEEGRQLAVHHGDGQDQKGHQRKAQEGARAAVLVEDGIPVADEGEDGARSDGVNVDQAQALLQAGRLGLHIVLFRHSISLRLVVLCSKSGA